MLVERAPAELKIQNVLASIGFFWRLKNRFPSFVDDYSDNLCDDRQCVFSQDKCRKHQFEGKMMIILKDQSNIGKDRKAPIKGKPVFWKLDAFPEIFERP